jgi:hypothetical protein
MNKDLKAFLIGSAVIFLSAGFIYIIAVSQIAQWIYLGFVGVAVFICLALAIGNQIMRRD